MENENNFTVMGYYMDRLEEDGSRPKDVGAGDVFVALYDDENGYYCYAPIGQHGDLDYDYLEECEEITVEEYNKISGHLYTPKEYLEQGVES
jgi:hypothetical protein